VKPGDTQRLIVLIESWAQDLLAQGSYVWSVARPREQAALKEAFGEGVSQRPE
jgi:hypothetical protein